ncbi:carbohydrate ABC transporter permease [Paenibacillus hemerocallicola]|jgi:ABC-type glycerol-3-phosphate transport system permease component|uniref:Carbohydrate ABC transporter permease n=1 Tax=Paenibacillus hemerocallicola TaxID=1172614 RepID=A0A5C4SX81_9BACL|nr:carbohydrate ABC transporter permease [Paenibacillus hemerocallicola]TNJ60492.1 carbohydrate ABC transporter permease [Paenibacillus hemerocallicola]
MIAHKSERPFQWINGMAFALFSLSMIAPLIHLAAVSLSSTQYTEAKQVYFWPKGLQFDVYKTIFGMDQLWRSLGVSVTITVFGTVIALLFTSTLAYALSRPIMAGRKIVLRAVVITFVFSAPMIPSYLVVRALHMEDTLWALMVPGALAAFNIIIMKTFFQGISVEMYEAAKIDGCTEAGLFGKIAVPLSMPVFATIALFHSVSQWNSYFHALIYIRSKELLPVQVLLRNLVISDEASSMVDSNFGDASIMSTPEMMKAGIILFATLPIIIVYPFLQKYFVKGATLGALKE